MFIKKIIKPISLIFYWRPNLYFFLLKLVVSILKVLDYLSLARHVNKLNWLDNHLIKKHTVKSKIFFSNKDTFDQSSDSIIIEPILNKMTKLKLLSRERSWVREGYIERIYHIQ